MSSPARRPGSRPTRRQRQDKANRLTLATGAFGLAAAVVLILSIVGIASFGYFVVLALVTVALAVMLRGAMR